MPTLSIVLCALARTAPPRPEHTTACCLAACSLVLLPHQPHPRTLLEHDASNVAVAHTHTHTRRRHALQEHCTARILYQLLVSDSSCSCLCWCVCRPCASRTCRATARWALRERSSVATSACRCSASRNATAIPCATCCSRCTVATDSHSHSHSR